VLAQASRDRAWTLTLIGKSDYLVEAEQLLQQAWGLADSANQQFRLELALERAILCIHQEDFEAAQHWSQQAKMLLPQAQLEAAHQQRYAIRIDYYRAEAYCRQGEHERAKQLFQEVLAAAYALDWQQIAVYTLNWLAEIALEQTDLEQAEQLLSQSFPVAQQQRDKRSIAFHARSRALLEHLKGNELTAAQWSQVATDTFNDLGMDSEVQEMRRWLTQIVRS
jgi:tetratricopeptide (TPR) repeat protein